MAMGHREKLKGGDEWDYLTKARRFYHHRAGQIKKIKQKFWKRNRMEAKHDTATQSRDTGGDA